MEWGYMGKVPSRGDFIVQGLPGELRERWFEWCQAALAVSREQLGDQWLDAYLTCPIWHFAAGPGALTDGGMIGTLIPSVDRVGRHFPFLVAGPHDGTLLDAWRQPGWFSAMEERVLAVLEDDWNETLWCKGLADIAGPEPAASRLQWPEGEGNLMLPGEAREEDWLTAVFGVRRGRVLWWTQGSAFVEPATLLTEGLPQVGQFAAMIAGQWRDHGWRQGVMVE
ncbi:MAG: type VI secretion system-associated protein TagF [Pseudomonadota bacterium]